MHAAQIAADGNICVCRARIGGQAEAAGSRQPDVALDDEIGRPTYQKQMLYVVAAHEHEAPVAVDGGRVHYRQACLAIAPAGHEGSERQAANHLYDDQHDHQHNQCRKRPQDCRAITGPRNAIEKV
jgi:hypothetical protein